jgi:hypothetical protein
MKKFIVLYHSPEGAAEKMANASPEEMQEGMKPWMDWAERCGDGLVDMGAPLGNGMKVGKDSVSPSEKNVVGHSILQAASMDEAVAMLKDHPHLTWMNGCEIEVYEVMPLPGM